VGRPFATLLAIRYAQGVGGAPPKRTPQPFAAPQGSASDRPTVVPDFDPEAFAHDSEARQRVEANTASEPTLEQARRHFRAGQYDQALDVLTGLLASAPFHPQASTLAAECRTRLEQACLSALGSPTTVLRLAVTPDELKQFKLDSVSGFLLGQLDGLTDIETVLDVSGVPRLLALRHLRNLLERGIVEPASEGMARARREPANEDRFGESEEDDAVVAVESGVLPVSSERPTLGAVPILLVERSALDALDLDPPARLLATLVDDRMTVEAILVAAEMETVGGLEVFGWLAEDGIVGFF
jgi:hypothetical protein